MAKLLSLLKADENQVRRMLVKELELNGYTPVVAEHFIYAEGTVPVLLMGHYDTVLDTPPKWIHSVNGILSAKAGLGADDRAGLYAICEMIKYHHCSVLFTGGEERGGIGATAFTKSGIKPTVNYCLEFDRRGDNDAVYYDGDNKDFEEFITSHGWRTALGSFTDICVVAPYLNCAAVNLSVGYQNEHRANETLDTGVMNTNIKRYQQLLDGKAYEWVEAPPLARWNCYGVDTWHDSYGFDRYYISALDYEDEIWATSLAEAVGTYLMWYSDVCFDDIEYAVSSDMTEEYFREDYGVDLTTSPSKPM